jgi:hypothetical protein
MPRKSSSKVVQFRSLQPTPEILEEYGLSREEVPKAKKSFPPPRPIARRHFRGKEEFWVIGYVAFDREETKPRIGYAHIRSEKGGIKIQVKQSEIEEIQPSKRYYTFHEVFGVPPAFTEEQLERIKEPPAHREARLAKLAATEQSEAEKKAAAQPHLGDITYKVHFRQ